MLHVTGESESELPRWEAAQPIRIFDVHLGNFVLPDERYHDLVRLIRESSKMLVAPIPSDAQVHLELCHLVGKGYFVLAHAWSIHC